MEDLHAIALQFVCWTRDEAKETGRSTRDALPLWSRDHARSGMCATCYTLRRQDEEHFGGLRETVLERDGYRCRVCDTPGGGKRSMIVHHRVPGRSDLKLMISLCPACHARVHRTKAVLAAMPPLLLVLWREQHPSGHEQKAFNFEKSVGETAVAVSLF